MTGKLIFCLTLIILNVTSVKAQQLQIVIDSLQRKLESCKTDTSKIKILDALSFSLSKIDPNKGLTFAIRLKELATTINNRHGLAAAYSNLGLNYTAKCEYKQAIPCYLNSIKVFKNLGNKKGEGTVLSNLSLLFLNQSEYVKSLEYAFNALAILESINDHSTIALVQENIGTVYLEQKQFQKALYFYSLAYKNYQKNSDLAKMARVIGNKGIILNEKGEYTGALKCHFLALKNNQIKGLKRSEQINLANIAITYDHLKCYDKAIDYHLKALKISKQLKDKKSISINSGNTGEVYLKIASQTKNLQSRNVNLKKGITFLKNAINICREINFKGPLIEFNKYLSDAYAMVGMYKPALNEYKEFTRIKDSAYAKETAMEIASLETKRELELKNKEITLNKQQKEILLLEAKNKKNEKIIYLIGIGFLSTLVFIMFTFIRQRLQAHRKVLRDIAYTQSHVVRAPLARILGLINVIDYANPSDKDNEIILKYIRDSAIELDVVINNIVNKSSLQPTEKEQNFNFSNIFASNSQC